MVRSVARDLPEQGKNNPAVNQAAGNGGQKMGQYSWFTVYEVAATPISLNTPYLSPHLLRPPSDNQISLVEPIFDPSYNVFNILRRNRAAETTVSVCR